MVNGLVVGIVGLPLLAGALIAAVLRRANPSIAHRVALAAAGLTGLGALALLPYAGHGPAIVVQWLPGTGPMGLTIGASGLYAVLVTTWGAFLVLFGTPPLSPPNNGEDRGGGGEYPPMSWSVMLLALAATNVAFLTDHFLARYAALEIVALCIALALLVEVRNSAGIRLAWNSYLLLRLGDAGLLIAILILMDASGTLSIGPALEFALSSIEGAGGALDAPRLGWIVAGFILAVWVKLSGWPFHLWSQSGRRLSLASQAWLYATVMPNLGAYLLYRVTPLLALTGPLQTAALWLGAGGAALAMLVALTQADLRTALVYLGAAQGGLALFVAASGVNAVVWLGLLALTPLRLLLFLAADAAQSSPSVIPRRLAASLFALGGLALTTLGLLTTWWTRGAGAPLDALFVAEAAVALSGVWTVLIARRLFGPADRVARGAAVHWTRWVVVGLLGAGVMVGCLASVALIHRLAAAVYMKLPAVPRLPTLVLYAATSPALLAVTVLTLAVWRLQRRARLEVLTATEPAGEVYDLEEGLTRAAQALQAVVEVGFLEQIVALTVRIVVDGARLTYNVVEQEGLEGLLRRAVRAVLGLSRGLQRWHTGRLRLNLLWGAVSLTLAVLALVLYGG